MAATNNKTNINSSNGHKTSDVSLNNENIVKTICRDSATGRIIDKNETSEADKLTLRAWKKTFENREKAA